LPDSAPGVRLYLRFAAHPFSHYSTNFFGILVFALAFFNIKKKSLPLTWLTTFIALFASISDPWFLATYFLPLLLTCGYFSWRQILPRKFTIILGISFIISMSHALQRLMGLPIQRFKLMPVAQWPDNAAWVVQLLGKSLNLFLFTPRWPISPLLLSGWPCSCTPLLFV
jgi:hypothetical protein